MDPRISRRALPKTPPAAAKLDGEPSSSSAVATNLARVAAGDGFEAAEAQASGQLPPPVLLAKDEITPVIRSKESKEAILDVIRKAEKTLDLTTHSIEDPDFVRELIAAGKRGCSVRILMSDPRCAGYSKHESEAIMTRMRALAENPGITLREFPNVRLQFGTSAYIPEMHMKVVVADGQRGYIGDSNLYFRGENLGAGVLIEGPSALGLSQVFLETWTYADGELGSERHRPLPSDGPIQLLTTRVSDREVKSALLTDIAEAKRSVFSMQYILSDPQLIQALCDLKRRRPELPVQVLLGRKYGTVGPVPLPVNLLAYRELRKAGVDVRFVSGEHFVHGKLTVVDRERTHVGSADLTVRSLEGNLEANARIESKQLAGRFVDGLASAFAKATAPKLRLRDRLAIPIGVRAEKLAFFAFSILQKFRQLGRLFHFKPEFFEKTLRAGSAVFDRRVRHEELPPLELGALPGLEGLAKQIELRFDVLSKETLKPDAPGIHLIAGHSEHRAQVIEELGASVSFTGDIGPGIYLTDHPDVAQEYSAIHEGDGTQDLLIYRAQVQKPFRIPQQTEEYERWLEEQPKGVKRAKWQRLSEFCRQRGYDCAIMEHFEGKGRSYVVVFDREKVEPVRHYQIRPKKTAGWLQVLREKFLPPYGVPGPSRARDVDGLSGAAPAQAGQRRRWSFDFSASAKKAYLRRAVDAMREQGLRDTGKLNEEIKDLERHAVCRLSDGSGRPVGLMRMIEGYDIARYAGIFKDEHRAWSRRPVAAIAVYPDHDPKLEYDEQVLRTALAAAAAYRAKTGGPDGLYIEVRPELTEIYERLGFAVAGRPFEAKAWDGQWVPMMLDLTASASEAVHDARAARAG